MDSAERMIWFKRFQYYVTACHFPEDSNSLEKESDLILLAHQRENMCVWWKSLSAISSGPRGMGWWHSSLKEKGVLYQTNGEEIQGRKKKKIFIPFSALKSHSTTGDKQRATVQSCRSPVEGSRSPRLWGFRRGEGETELYFQRTGVIRWQRWWGENMFFFFSFLNIFYWLCYYSCPIFFLFFIPLCTADLVPSALPPLVHAHGSYM